MTLFVGKYFDSRAVAWVSGGNENERARLVLSFRDGNPRLTAYSNIKNPKEGIIPFPTDLTTFTYVLSTIKEIADSPNGTKRSIDSLTTQYENDKPTANKKLVSTLYIGKSNSGIVYLSIIAPDKPKYVFEIKPSEWHIFKNSDGEKIEDSKVSSAMAKGLADVFLNYVSMVFMEYSKELALDKSASETNSNKKTGKEEMTSLSNSDFDEDLGF